jgi:hypothetical protein
MVFLKVDLELLTAGTLSKEAVLLYSYLTGLKRLSEQNNVKDDNGNIVVYCTTDKAMEILNVSKPTALKIFKELEELNYIQRKRRGQGKASYIYVFAYKAESDEITERGVYTQAMSEKNTDACERNSEFQNESTEQITENSVEVKTSPIDNSPVELDNSLNSERIMSVMREIIKQKDVEIPQNVVDMIICKIQFNNYRIYNIYRYIMKCVENYLANPIFLSDIGQRSTNRDSSIKSSPASLNNRFNNFDQREYSAEEMAAITKKLLKKA